MHFTYTYSYVPGFGISWDLVEICFACEVCYVCIFFPSPVGMYFCFAKLTDHNIFIILYGLTSVYFAVSHIIKCMG